MFGVKVLIEKLNTAINSGSLTETQLIQAFGAIETLERQGVSSVLSSVYLPNVVENKGRFFWLETEQKYVVSNGTTWSNDNIFGAIYDPLWGWGRNTFGQLGDTTTLDRSSPVSVVGLINDWVHVSTSRTTLAIRANGTMWGWGVNPVGDNTFSNRSSPVSIFGGFTDWVSASAGVYNSGAIRANGRLYMWGSSGWGRNADGSGDFGIVRTVPTEILGGFTDWVSLHHTIQSSVALRANGTIWGWGRNLQGAIGDGTFTSRLSPVSTVGGFTDWIFVGGGDAWSFGIRSNGILYAWGEGSNGVLGDGTATTKNSPVSVVGGFTDWTFATGGSYHSVGLRANGTAWSWGLNRAGSNGDGTSTGKSSPVSVVGGFTDWVSLGCAYNSTIGLRANGTLWGWGQNGNGELATNNTSSRSSPVSVVGGFTDWISISKCSVGGQRHFLGIRAR